MIETQQLEEKILGRKWFYNFKLPSGKITESYLPEFALPIHTTRSQMMDQFIA
jgi:hypothetical protein